MDLREDFKTETGLRTIVEDGMGNSFYTEDYVEWLEDRVKKLSISAVSGSADRYTKKLDKDWDDDIYTVEEWIRAVKDGCFCNFDGSGYWVKDGLKSNDEVFSTPPLDATHVVWYNK